MTDAPPSQQGDVVDGKVQVVVDGTKLGLSYTFYRGEGANFLPMRAGMAKPEALRDNVLAGWMPPAPFIDRDSTIVAFGSCFANHISRYLNNLGFDVATKRDNKAYVSAMGDGIVNVFAILQQFEWAWTNKVPEVELWHGYKAEEFGYDESVRLKTRDLFDEADVFIITLGLSEVWYDEPTGEIFWRAVPFDKFDPTRHKFRVASSAETLATLRAIYALIRRHRPQAAIIFTVSPIPLSATFRPVSCVSANTVSKAILRAAIDELHREYHPTDPLLFYYPAYEVVTQCFDFAFADDFRHPLFHVLDVNMKAFERYFCSTGLTDDDLAALYGAAKDKDRALGSERGGEIEDLINLERAKWLQENSTTSILRHAGTKPKRDPDIIERERHERKVAYDVARAQRQADFEARRETERQNRIARNEQAKEERKAARKAEHEGLRQRRPITETL